MGHAPVPGTGSLARRALASRMCLAYAGERKRPVRWRIAVACWRECVLARCGLLARSKTGWCGVLARSCAWCRLLLPPLAERGCLPGGNCFIALASCPMHCFHCLGSALACGHTGAGVRLCLPLPSVRLLICRRKPPASQPAGLPALLTRSNPVPCIPSPAGTHQSFTGWNGLNLQEVVSGAPHMRKGKRTLGRKRHRRTPAPVCPQARAGKHLPPAKSPRSARGGNHSRHEAQLRASPSHQPVLPRASKPHRASKRQ